MDTQRATSSEVLVYGSRTSIPAAGGLQTAIRSLAASDQQKAELRNRWAKSVEYLINMVRCSVRTLFRRLGLRHDVQDFRRRGAPSVLLHDLAEEYNALAID